MKKINLLLLSMLLTVSVAVAQVPEAINFQAIARDVDGEVMVDANIQIRLTVLDGSATGTEVYQELRALTTNSYGSFAFQIGKDADYVTAGSFADIAWETGEKYLKIDYDPTNQFVWDLTLGTIQLVSVPYALAAGAVTYIDLTDVADGDVLVYNSSTGNFEPGQTPPVEWSDIQNKPNVTYTAGTGIEITDNIITSTATSGSGVPQYSQTEIEALTPTPGMLVFNTDYKILQFYDGTQWTGNQSSGCVPEPGYPHPGADQFGVAGTTTTLEANAPSFGVNGKWSVVSGTGGSFTDDTNPNTTFTGTDGVYTLKWSLMTVCDTSSNDMQLSFWTTPPVTGGGLYVYPADMQAQWYNGDYIVTGATSDTDGQANTTAIVAAQGAGNYAAYICDTLTAYGYSDWYLPAKDELNEIYLNKDLIGGFSPYYYWSSTEDDFIYAWYQYFGNGYQDGNGKKAGSGFRCVRRD